MQELTFEVRRMVNPFTYIFRSKVTEEFEFSDAELEALGSELKAEVNKVFGHSLAIRELDSGKRPIR